MRQLQLELRFAGLVNTVHFIQSRLCYDNSYFEYQSKVGHPILRLRVMFRSFLARLNYISHPSETPHPLSYFTGLRRPNVGLIINSSQAVHSCLRIQTFRQFTTSFESNFLYTYLVRISWDGLAYLSAHSRRRCFDTWE